MFKKQPKQSSNDIDAPPVPSKKQSDLLEQDITIPKPSSDSLSAPPSLGENEASGSQSEAKQDYSTQSASSDFEIPPAPKYSSAGNDSTSMPPAPQSNSTQPETTQGGDNQKSDYEEYSEKLYNTEKQRIKDREQHINYQKPIFVEVEDYRRVLDYIQEIKNDIKTSENVTARLEEVRAAKDKEFDKWHHALEDIQRKLLYVDKTLFEEES